EDALKVVDRPAAREPGYPPDARRKSMEQRADDATTRVLSGAQSDVWLAQRAAVRGGAASTGWHAGREGFEGGHGQPQGRRIVRRGPPAHADLQSRDAPTCEARAGPCA